MHLNTGYPAEALPLIRRQVRVFADYEAIVAPSGSCTGAIRHQYADTARRFGDERLADAAEAVAARTYELSEFLVDVTGVTDVGGVLPAPGDLPPHLPLAAAAAGRRQAAGAAAGRRGHRPGGAARPPSPAAVSAAPSP